MCKDISNGGIRIPCSYSIIGNSKEPSYMKSNPTPFITKCANSISDEVKQVTTRAPRIKQGRTTSTITSGGWLKLAICTSSS